jgi:predicted AAA+ superfamily ATPase
MSICYQLFLNLCRKTGKYWSCACFPRDLLISDREVFDLLSLLKNIYIIHMMHAASKRVMKLLTIKLTTEPANHLSCTSTFDLFIRETQAQLIWLNLERDHERAGGATFGDVKQLIMIV